MPGHYGGGQHSSSFSGGNSGRDTGSDYGQFDRAVSQAQNNPAPSSGGDGVNWSPSDDIDSTTLYLLCEQLVSRHKYNSVQ